MPLVDISWKYLKFSELTLEQLYAILRLRQKVFVVEQNCAYVDADQTDNRAVHLIGCHDDELIAYARIFFPGDYFQQYSIGRIVSHPNHRGQGIGREVIKRAIDFIEDRDPANSIKIAAQSYLLKLYREFGFEIAGEEFLEDDIPHYHMVR